VVFQDVLGQTAMLQFMQTGRREVAVPTTIHCDHLIRARTDGRADLLRSLDCDREVYEFLRSAATRYGAGFWPPGAGIIHQVVLENYAFPGQLVVGTDSHTPNAGGLGACAVGVGGMDAVEVIAGLAWELLYPRRIAVRLSGEIGGWTAPKDVIIYLAGLLGVAGATNAVIEYIGPGARRLSATGKATITNMGAELGATTSIFPADLAMERYLRATGRAGIAAVVERHRSLLEPDPEAEAEPERYYDRVVDIDLSSLEPHVAGPHSPDRVRPLSALAAEVAAAQGGIRDTIAAALIGSCTNSSYEDMSRAAHVAQQARAHGVKAAAPLYVTPGSERVRATTERDGQLDALRVAGAVVLANACGPCIGQWQAAAAGVARTILTSYNRNFPGRNDGLATTMNFIASPEIVVAMSLAGRLSFNPLTDTLVGADGIPFRLVPPPAVADVPSSFAPTDGALTVIGGGAADDAAVLAIDPSSDRLQPMTPWPAWDGRDFALLPVLVKTKGKTTTDQISPAGAWLRYRGHLERFSDNLLSGAVNAWTGAIGTTTHARIGEAPRPIAEVAREYRAARERWVIVGDRNYGEGSSREHAALSPRLLHCAAVIARSFARIHETNLKKQGLLALTFEDPADYDRVRERDAVSLTGLRSMAPGKPIAGILHHTDGSTETLRLLHSYSASQLEWFRAGSARRRWQSSTKTARRGSSENRPTQPRGSSCPRRDGKPRATSVRECCLPWPSTRRVELACLS
jgi:aconitate hydratase